MARTSFSLTAKRGQTKKDVVIAAAANLATTDAVQITMDVTNMTRGEVTILLQEEIAAFLEAKFPPL